MLSFNVKLDLLYFYYHYSCCVYSYGRNKLSYVLCLMSMLLEHCNLAHDGRRVKFKMDVTGTYHRDSTKRQISEGLMIEKTPRTRLMNSKSEWNTPNMPQCVVRRLSER